MTAAPVGPVPGRRPGTGRRTGLAQVLRSDLAREITDGRYPAGGKLPAERELAARLHASRGSLRQALLLLSDSGLVVAEPQSGWFVRDSRLGEPPSVLLSFTEMAGRRGVGARTSVLRRSVRDPTFSETERLGLPVSARFLGVERVRLLDDDPVCVDRSVIALDRVAGLESTDLSDASLYTVMSRLGATPVRSDFTVEAAGASERDSALLHLDPGAPVLLTDELTYDENGVVLLRGRSVYRANSYRFHATLRRR